MAFYIIRPKSGSASQWQSSNMILHEREIGIEYPPEGLGKGSVKIKQGDGKTPWNSLPYAVDINVSKQAVETIISTWNSTVDAKVAEVKKVVADGKNKVGGVVGGNQDSTYQVLANNAQAIKTDRDNKQSQVGSLNTTIKNLQTSLTNVTTDRNNWQNTANSRYNRTNGHASSVSTQLSKNGEILSISADNLDYGDGTFRIEGSNLIVNVTWGDSYGYYYGREISLPLATNGTTSLPWILGGTVTISGGIATISISASSSFCYQIIKV